MRQPLVRALMVFQYLIFANLAQADLATQFSQIHFRSGAVVWGYGGLYKGGSQNFTALDLEYEVFTSSRVSTPIRAMFVNDFAAGRMVYSLVGIGRRYYVFSGGVRYDYSSSVGTDQVSSLPKWRIYIGGETGISQLVVQTPTPTTVSSSALLEIGPSVGGIFQIDKSLGFELQGGLAAGLGFSGVSQTAFIMRVLFGGAYYF